MNWFSSLVASEAHLPQLEAELRTARAVAVETLPLDQGKKRTRVLAWSFMSAPERAARGRVLWGDAGREQPQQPRG